MAIGPVNSNTTLDAKTWEAKQTAKLHGGAWVDPVPGKAAFGALSSTHQRRTAPPPFPSQPPRPTTSPKGA